MKKFKYYPLWKINDLEEFLSKSELEGWRLSGIKYSCIFYFVKCKSKNSDYVLLIIWLTITLLICINMSRN